MVNKKIIWLSMFLVSMLSIIFSYHYFDKAIPLVSLSITMDKDEAKQKALEVAKKYDWKVAEYDTAVWFHQDNDVMSFADLEAGGKDVCKSMIAEGLYQPYRWAVRFFKEKEVFESVVTFTPDGRPYGFRQILSENYQEEPVSKQKAQDLAEDMCKAWDVNLGDYTLVEYTPETLPAGRLDHTFVYEREGVSLGKGFYRLRVIVSGSHVSRLSHEIKIPDEFYKRYAHMRSANDLYAMLFQGGALLFYLLMLGLIVLFMLYMRSYLLVAKTIKFAVCIMGVIFVWKMNNIPLIWTYYDTTTSKLLFISKAIFGSVLGSLFWAVFLSVIILIAEAAQRYVFKNQVQFFSLWSKDVGGTYTILEQTLLGYVIAFANLAYIIGFSIVAKTWGWWMPLSTLVDPNVLSSYIPFLSPLIMALYAGFGEEFEFRALPIAGTLFLTRNAKYKTVVFWSLLIVQAIVFGGIHANYPAQPAYYRIVELVFPFTIFGFVYARFGLLPVIVAHFMYDAMLFTLPIMVSDLWMQKICVLIGMSIPLLVVFFRAMKQGGLKKLSDAYYNSAWQVTEHFKQKTLYVREQGIPLSDNIKKLCYISGLIGLLLFSFSKRWQFDTAPITLSKDKVQVVADEAIKKQFGDIGSGWNYMIELVNNQQELGNKFIMQSYGKEVFEKLLGSYVLPPYYHVRYAKFDGSLQERAEEYGLWINGQSEIISFYHTQLESDQGADLSEYQALALAQKAISEKYDLSKDDIELVSSDNIKHEFRRDWEIKFKDIKNYSLDKGQARIFVRLMGDEISRMYRYIHVPEDWTRQHQSDNATYAMYGYISIILFMLLMLFVIRFAFMQLGVQLYYIKQVSMLFICLFMASWIFVGNAWNLIVFNTSQPLMSQIFMKLSGSLISISISSLGLALLLIILCNLGKKGSTGNSISTMLAGVGVGIFLWGVHSILGYFVPVLMPRVPVYGFLNNKIAIVGMLQSVLFSSMISQFISVMSVLLFARWAYDKLQTIGAPLTIFALCGFVCMEIFIIYSFSLFVLYALISGLIWFVISWFVVKENTGILWIILATFYSCRLLPSMWYGAYPLMLFDGMMAIGLITVCTIIIVRKMQKA